MLAFSITVNFYPRRRPDGPETFFHDPGGGPLGRPRGEAQGPPTAWGHGQILRAVGVSNFTTSTTDGPENFSMTAGGGPLGRPGGEAQASKKLRCKKTTMQKNCNARKTAMQKKTQCKKNCNAKKLQPGWSSHYPSSPLFEPPPDQHPLPRKALQKKLQCKKNCNAKKTASSSSSPFHSTPNHFPPAAKPKNPKLKLKGFTSLCL